MSDKTEQPTTRRLDQARRDGDLAVSSAVTQAGVTLVVLALAPAAMQATAARSLAILRESFARAQSPDLGLLTSMVGVEVLKLAAPILAAAAATAILIGMIQTKGVFALKRVAPDLARMSPLSLFKNIFSMQRLFAIVRAIATTAVVAYLVVDRVKENAGDLARSTGNASQALATGGNIALGIAWDVAVVLIALAVVDLIVTHRSWINRLKMSKSDVKRDHREADGNPEIKAARERAHHELLSQATLAAVKDATVVVVNPIRLANALRYDEDQDEAPVLLAKGEGDLARRIVETARMHGIPVVQDIPVARALTELTEGDTIPAALYEAVATILQDLYESDDGTNQ